MPDNHDEQSPKAGLMRAIILGMRGLMLHRSTEPDRVIDEQRRLRGKGRNQPCPCGSGKKTKRCCGPARQADLR